MQRKHSVVSLVVSALCVVSGVALLLAAPGPDALLARPAPHADTAHTQHLSQIASGAYARGVVSSDPTFFASLHDQWSDRRRTIRQWCGSATSGKADGTHPVLYPFSGFDAIWPLACYPNSKRYIMLAKQPGIPSESDLNMDVTQGIRSALHGFVQHGYFTTIEQNGAKIDASRFLAVVLKVLYRADFQTVEVCPGTTPAEGCVLLRFKREEAAMSQEIMYWSGEVLFNEAFYKYIETVPKFYSFFKATEYSVQAAPCTPQGTAGQGYLFHRLITIVTQRSEVVIQDDSGIPFKYLDRAPFSAQIFGAYEGPPYLTDSCTFFQPELAKRYYTQHQQGGVPPLPVSAFGYDVHRNCLLGMALAGDFSSLAGADLQLPAVMTNNFPDAQDQQFCMWTEQDQGGHKAIQLNAKCRSTSDIIPGPDISRCQFSPDVSSVGIIAVRG